ncbi:MULTISPECIES: type II toxin-antitoxin system HipA family toxin [Bradyrhizobium]|uniref:type II toxin-antitoxin system HipA family toxin n=1 Tax=Bradyrhizobium TaxID=374 RepID=UPI001AD77982|nr:MULTISPECIES: HipA domain-containing protein [Bradyrhizobium]MBO4228397.1 type II toxin-antitoxin system HipA family toxin [Bradyrhizobium neotropicale]MCA1455177.1 HipA domain-containing protein [Bradyrhizobium sp. BRP22]
MPDVSVLNVQLGGRAVGTITHVQGNRNLFAFDQAYIDDANRPTLSLSFKDQYGGLITDFKPVGQVVPSFFSNLLPEGPLRKYLAERAGVKEHSEFFLLWMLGQDLPGAVSVRPADGEELPPQVEAETTPEERRNMLRFSLAGVQLKFSALQNGKKGGGLVIPVEGVGGSWIVKLPSQQYPGVPENEYSMMTLAKAMGMDVPDLELLDLEAIDGLPEGIGELKGQAMAIRRFDRGEKGPVHIEDFAQVFSIYPEGKYEHATYRRIAGVLGIETGDADIAEFIRRLVFSALIGNADMHLKNWSLIYTDGKTPTLSPAYDLLSTIPYIPDDTMALKYSRTKKMSEFSKDELKHLAAKARLREKLVLDTAAETVQRFKTLWATEKKNLPLEKKVVDIIDAHAASIPLYTEL